MGKEYNKCAREIGKCVGLKKGVKGYYDCAKKSNCKKTEREKLEKIKGKIQKRNIDKSVIRIGNFFYSAQNRIHNLRMVQSYINDYSRHKESYDKPRIHKKTKDFWAYEMKKANDKFKTETGSTWWKTNYPNVKITTVNLYNKLSASIKKLEKYLKEQFDKGIERNRRKSKIRDMVNKENYTRNLIREENKRLAFQAKIQKANDRRLTARLKERKKEREKKKKKK